MRDKPRHVPVLLRPVRGVAQYIMLVLACIFMLGANVLYTNHVNHESEIRNARQAEQIARAWCAFIIPLDDRYKANPPKTDEDVRVAGNIRALRVSYACPETPPPAPNFPAPRK